MEIPPHPKGSAPPTRTEGEELIRKVHRSHPQIFLYYLLSIIGPSFAASISYWIYRKLGGTHFFIPMGLSFLIWHVIGGTLFNRMIYLPCLSRALVAEINKRGER